MKIYTRLYCSEYKFKNKKPLVTRSLISYCDSWKVFHLHLILFLNTYGCTPFWQEQILDRYRKSMASLQLSELYAQLPVCGSQISFVSILKLPEGRRCFSASAECHFRLLTEWAKFLVSPCRAVDFEKVSASEIFALKVVWNRDGGPMGPMVQSYHDQQMKHFVTLDSV